ncbi:MAG TPA: aspartate racemase [Marinilabiliaceae bacterium]|nr:aspartate racemase [Marinilabiliaceae bacterium]HBX88901.1 aspartate racemase [Marinilabiliaceae bacterium]
MKKIGLIGGLGPEATVDYYKAIIDSFKEKNNGALDYPEIIIYSVNMDHFIAMVKRANHQGASDYLAKKLQALVNAGSEFIALSANTPHLFFDDLQSAISVPMISIVEATARRAKALGIKRAGLIGTSFTMRAGFYQDVFKKYDLEIEIPEKEEMKYINEKLFSEIELGIFKDETRQGIIDIIGKMKNDKKIEGIIMGCTELPLILNLDEYHGIPSLNTSLIHVKEIVEYCLNGN